MLRIALSQQTRRAKKTVLLPYVNAFFFLFFFCELIEVRYSPTGSRFELDVVLLAGVVDELDAGVLLPVPHRLQDVRLHVI